MSRVEETVIPPETNVAAVGALTGAAPTGGTRGRRRGAALRLLGSELRLVFTRKRNLVLLAGLALVPIVVGLAIYLTRNTAMDSAGPAFLDRVTQNGLFLVTTSLMVCITFLLPFVVSVIAGDSIAGEAQAGTLRYLLTVPVPRTRLIAIKGTAVFTFAAAAGFMVGISGLLTGGLLFGWSDFTLLSGDTVSLGQGFARTAGIVVYVALMLLSVAAIGLFFSTLTEVPMAAMAATIITSIVSNIIETLPQLSAVHPFLFTRYWMNFGEFLRGSIDWGVIGQGIAVQGAWAAVFCALAWSRFTTADISS